jgi:hypothetical protein
MFITISSPFQSLLFIKAKRYRLFVCLFVCVTQAAGPCLVVISTYHLDSERRFSHSTHMACKDSVGRKMEWTCPQGKIAHRGRAARPPRTTCSARRRAPGRGKCSKSAMRKDCTAVTPAKNTIATGPPTQPSCATLHASESTPEPITAVMMCAIAVHTVPAYERVRCKHQAEIAMQKLAHDTGR